MIQFRNCSPAGTSDRMGATPTPIGLLGRRFLLFAAVGLVGTLAHYAAMVALVQGLGVRPVAASVAGFLVGMAVNYVLNYRYTFRSAKRHGEAATKFFAVGCCGLGLNTALMYVLTGPAGLHYIVAQLGATALVLLWNFGANQLWTFACEGYER